MSLLLERLAFLEVQITRVVLDSAKVFLLPSAARTVVLEVPYPIDVARIDTEELRKAIGRQMARMFQEPGAKSGGNAQKRFRICLSRPLLAEELQSIAADELLQSHDDTLLPSLDETERVQLRNARVGQGAFREALLSKFGGRCPLTWIESPELLVASHIKPWAVCTNQERLDPENGLLLSALADRLFDRGFMSFSDHGEPVFSRCLSSRDLELLNGHFLGRLELDDGSRKYLDYHRRVLFRGQMMEEMVE